jgi:DNA-directed RNA polymerase beta subunit
MMIFLLQFILKDIKLKLIEIQKLLNKQQKIFQFKSISEIKHLNDDGIVTVGTFVKPGDILVGKVISNNTSEQLPESKLLRAIFGAKAKVLKIIHIECQMVNMVELLKL